MPMLDKCVVGMSHRADPGLKAAPTASNTADTISGGHTGGRTLGLGEAKEQEGRPYSTKKFSQDKLALRAHLRTHGKQTAALHAHRRC